VCDRVPFGSLTTATGATSTIVPATVVTTNGSTTAPGLFGQRVYSIGLNFTRFRINRLLACYRPAVGTTTNGVVAVGFVDDPLPGFVNVTGVNFVEELRCSHADSIYREVEVEWKPVDPSVWYYVQPDVTATQTTADQRLECPCAIAITIALGPAVATTFGIMSLYYDITFEGADSSSLTA
jgi:hypothetical protein